ncbi:hypothetical protein F8M41_026095 [Gigaspora margarita]|uniref:Uncharacterized protein n=1 Tax=Gigaspora margarita TaxID=4874 RepID=A0A8H4A9M8_GIGMA|nr:hypothetical protein F8M41_026095 [Gigaspora margarita]
MNLDQNIDAIILSLLEVKKQINEAKDDTTATTTTTAKKHSKRYYKGLSLYENIAKLQRELTEDNDAFVKLYTKFCVMQRKYEPNDD